MYDFEKAVIFTLFGIGWMIVSTVAVMKGNFLIASVSFSISLGHVIPVIICIFQNVRKWKQTNKNNNHPIN